MADCDGVFQKIIHLSKGNHTFGSIPGGESVMVLQKRMPDTMGLIGRYLLDKMLRL